MLGLAQLGRVRCDRHHDGLQTRAYQVLVPLLFPIGPQALLKRRLSEIGFTAEDVERLLPPLVRVTVELSTLPQGPRGCRVASS